MCTVLPVCDCGVGCHAHCAHRGGGVQVRYASGAVPVADLRLEMQKTMQEHAAVFRTGPVLDEGCAKMQKVYDTMANDLKVRGMRTRASLFVVGHSMHALHLRGFERT